MKTMRILLSAGLFFVALHAATPAIAKVVATVNGANITDKMVKDGYATLPKKSRRPLDDIYLDIVQRLVDQKLLEQAAEKANIRDEANVKENLDSIIKRLLREEYIRRQVAKKVTDSAVKKRYRELKKEFEGKPEVHARHILLDTEDEAKAVIKELEGGADFATLAKKKSKGPSASHGGDLGYFIRDAMVPEFANTAFNLKKGQYTKSPVQTRFGWHVIKVEDKRTASTPPFEEVEPEIRRALADKEIAALVKKLRGESKIDIKVKPKAKKK